MFAQLMFSTRSLRHVRHVPFSSRVVAAIGDPLPRLPEHGDCIYLDYQATTPVWPEVAAAATPYLTHHWGNPSSDHAFGWPCARAVSKARHSVAQLIGAKDDEILFVSCGSEADNHAIVGAVEAEEARRRGAVASGTSLPHIVTSNVEHPAVEACIEALREAGRVEVSYVPVDSEGRLTAGAVCDALRESTVLVSIMHANNEVGSLQPLGEIADAVRACHPRALIHSDAAQSVGKVTLDLRDELRNVDLLTVVGHKIGAPKGVGALYIRDGVGLPKLLHGGGQEAGRRAGTECVVLQVRKPTRAIPHLLVIIRTCNSTPSTDSPHVQFHTF